tara:strand:+ start:90 stop:245 length:156 start_codon:yes stop_codon:yes gene_type:complete
MTIRAVRITEYLNKYEAREYVKKMRGKRKRIRDKEISTKLKEVHRCIAESE